MVQVGDGVDVERRDGGQEQVALALLLQASGGTVRQVVKMQQGLTQEIARSIVKVIKDKKFKKTQAQIQADTVSVSSPSRDELQDVIALLKEQTYDVELKFENYRSQ